MGLADGGPLAGGRLVGGVSHWLPPSAPSPRVRAVSFEIVFLSSPTTAIPILYHYATGLQLLPIYSMPSIPVSCRERSAREIVFRVWDYRLNHSISFSVDVDVDKFENALRVYFILSKALKLASNSFIGR